MHTLMRGLAASATALVAGALLVASASPTQEGAPSNYKFRTPPANSLGVQGMADLRGKPVLIDFWGTR